MPTLAQVRSTLSRYAGSGNTFLDRLNEVRSRVIQTMNFKEKKQQVQLSVGSDVDGNSIVTLEPQWNNILAGAIQTTDNKIYGAPMGVRNSFTEFDQNGWGYGGLTQDFQEVTGRFAVYQEWTSPMYIRLKFEATEVAGTVHLNGRFNGDMVYSLYGATWVVGEKIDYVGTATVTSTKKFDAIGFEAVKPTTNGRITVWTVDDGGVETQVGTWFPSETVVRRKRYKIPTVTAVSATTSTVTPSTAQYYTKTEIDSFFSDVGTITVSAAGTHDLVYSAYFTRILRVVAQAGSGSYTHKFTLDNATVKDGGTLRVKLEISASANPTLEFYDNTTGGTLLQSISGDSSNAQYLTLVFEYSATDGAWYYEGKEMA